MQHISIYDIYIYLIYNIYIYITCNHIDTGLLLQVHAIISKNNYIIQLVWECGIFI